LPDDLDDLGFRTTSLGEDIVSVPVIFDTSASHHFSGSCNLLHNFQHLSKPLSLLVATSTNQFFITGVDLRFKAADKHVVAIRGVLFCEKAGSNFISMAA
jgi:hypothetical protein